MIAGNQPSVKIDAPTMNGHSMTWLRWRVWAWLSRRKGVCPANAHSRVILGDRGRSIAVDDRFSDEFVGNVLRSDVAVNGFRSDAAEWLAEAARLPWWRVLRRRRYLRGALACVHAADVWERVS